MTEFKNKLINDFPEYLFNEINTMKVAARQKGRDIIDLGYGNPDLPSHPLVVEKLIDAAQLKKKS